MKYLQKYQINSKFLKLLFEKQRKKEFYQIDGISSNSEIEKLKRILLKEGILEKDIKSSKYQDNKKIFNSKNILKIQTGRIPEIYSFRINFEKKVVK